MPTRGIADELREATLAVVRCRLLARTDPGRHLPGLALALRNQSGAMFATPGRHEEAVTVCEEAVDLYRRLAGADSRHQRDLANTLFFHSLQLGLMGRRADALVLAEESVELYRTLARSSPDAYLPAVAEALVNLGNQQAELGRHNNALASIRESVVLRRRQAGIDPAVGVAELASALISLGIKLEEMGRRDEALAAVQEGVDRYREAAAIPPYVDVGDHWIALVTLIDQLRKLGREAEAAPHQRNAAELYRHIAAVEPDRVAALDAVMGRNGFSVSEDSRFVATPSQRQATDPRPDDQAALIRAANLNEDGLRVMREGRPEEARVHFQDAIDLLQRIDKTAARSQLAVTFHNLGIVLTKVGRHADALDPIDQAVHIHRALAKADPARLAMLASSLNNLGWQLLALKRFDDAVAPLLEAIEIHRGQAGEGGAALARSLYNLGVALGHLGRRPESVTVTEEAVEIHRKLAEADQNADQEPYLDSLIWLGKQQRLLGRRREARATNREAKALRRRR